MIEALEIVLSSDGGERNEDEEMTVLECPECSDRTFLVDGGPVSFLGFEPGNQQRQATRGSFVVVDLAAKVVW